MPRKPASREVIEKLLWDKRLKAGNIVLTYIHRGVEGERKTLSASRILRLRGGWIIYLDEKGVESQLPLHRVVEIRNTITGEVLWKKAEPSPKHL